MQNYSHATLMSLSPPCLLNCNGKRNVFTGLRSQLVIAMHITRSITKYTLVNLQKPKRKLHFIYIRFFLARNISKLSEQKNNRWQNVSFFRSQELDNYYDLHFRVYVQQQLFEIRVRLRFGLMQKYSPIYLLYSIRKEVFPYEISYYK